MLPDWLHRLITSPQLMEPLRNLEAGWHVTHTSGAFSLGGSSAGSFTWRLTCFHQKAALKRST